MGVTFANGVRWSKTPRRHSVQNNYTGSTLPAWTEKRHTTKCKEVFGPPILYWVIAG